MSHLLIQEVHVFKVELPLKDGNIGIKKSIQVLDATIVKICTNRGICGFGEVVPVTSINGVGELIRAGLKMLIPYILGSDPTHLSKINEIMDNAIDENNYAKAAIDMACWDILGKITQQPLCILFGGRFGASVPICHHFMRHCPIVEDLTQGISDGYECFRLSLAPDTPQDITEAQAIANALQSGQKLVVDAHASWLTDDAMRISRVLCYNNLYIEQPCKSLNDCHAIRQHIAHPIILGDAIDSVDKLISAHTQSLSQCININIYKVGGLTKARQLRDLAISLGYAVGVKACWASDIGTSAVCHLAHSTPERYRLPSTAYNSYITVSTAKGGPSPSRGTIRASTLPGLGVTPRDDVLGDPVFSIGE